MVTILFVFAVCALVASAYLYFQKETSDYATAAAFTIESKKIAESAKESSEKAILAAEKAATAVVDYQDEVSELSKAVEDLKDRMLKIEANPPQTVSIAPQVKPFLIEVIDRRPSVRVPEAAKRAKSVLKESRLSQ